MTNRTTTITARALGPAILLASVLAGCGDDNTSPEASAPITAAPTTSPPVTEVADDDADTDTEAVTTLTDGDRLGDYTLADDEFGTMTTVTVSDTTRTIATNALPDHETGEFPNSGTRTRSAPRTRRGSSRPSRRSSAIRPG